MMPNGEAKTVMGSRGLKILSSISALAKRSRSSSIASIRNVAKASKGALGSLIDCVDANDPVDPADRKFVQDRLNQAIVQGDVLTVRQALNAGASPEWTDKDGQRAIHWAASSGHWPVCKLLLDLGVDPNMTTTVEKRSALVCALVHRRGRVAIELIRAGVDLKLTDLRGRGPMFHAVNCAEESVGILEALHQRGLGLDSGTDLAGQTHLARAAILGNESAALWLLDKGANPTDGGPQTTPLHEAAGAGLPALCLRLIKLGANPNAPDFEGATPLHRASAVGHTDVLMVLLGHGGDPLASDNRRRTVLHLGAEGGHGDVCALLIQRGADPNVIDENGRSAKGLAKDSGHAHMPPLIDACVNSLAASRAIERIIGKEAPQASNRFSGHRPVVP